MASSAIDLHFVLLPLMAQGHMIPMVDIARILAQRGATVTIITTPVNANRFKPVIARAIQSNLKINVLELKLQVAEVGLPEGCENFDMLPSSKFSVKLFEAMDLLEESMEKLLRELSPSPSCIISDNFFSWTTDMARRFNIPRLVFHGPGCFTFLCIHIVSTSDILDRIESDSDRFVLPGLAHRIELTKTQASGWGSRQVKEVEEFFQRAKEAEKAADGIVVNSFEELEPMYVKEFAKSRDKKVWCIGPVSLCNESKLDMAERGNKAGIDGHDCLKWLDSKEPGSVVYVCLGSLTRASTEQAIELGLGLESTNRPFIWCIRNKNEELERWLTEEGYEGRVKDRSLIIHGWAPQVLILSHRAIGGFVTHCGWNSTLEGVSAGIPMVTWPHFADQFFNESFIVEVLRIGVRIGMEVPVLYGEEDVVGVVIKSDVIKTAVNELMDEGEEGEGMRKRAVELAEMARRAMEEGGSSYRNTTTMIQEIVEKLAKNKKPS